MTTSIVAILVVIIAGAYCASVYSSGSGEVNLALEHAVNASSGEDAFRLRPQNQNEISGQGNMGGIQGFEQGPDINQPLEDIQEVSPDQRIDLFTGQMGLVYSVVVAEDGTILRTDSPAINLDETVLNNALEGILASSDFSLEEGSIFSGKIASESLFYRAKVHNNSIYIALADSSNFEKRMNEAIFGSLALAGITLVLTLLVSFFLARLFLRPVEEAWVKQRRFIADASHELKTPLTVIMANTEIVRSEPQKTVSHTMKWLNGIMDESERMQGLIADLLLLARMDDKGQNETHLAQEDVDFSQAVEGSIVSFEAIAFERNIRIEEDIEPDLYVKGIPSRLVRLPDILLDNACKYTESKGIIKVSLKTENARVILSVFNSGSEISENDMTHLFDRFYRADESRSDEIPGYGLGLSIAQNVTGESQGTIEVVNVAGEGVTFTVSLPLQPKPT